MQLLTSLLINALAVVLYMSAWFLLSYRKKRLDVVDTAWGGGFIVVALWSYIQSPHLYSGIITLLVGLWGVRLALHIASRNKGKRNDPRYDTLTANWNTRTYWLRAYVSIFMTQGALILLVSLPITLATGSEATRLGVAAQAGMLLWLAGICIELVADAQLRHFLRTRTAEHPVMDTGLWRYSRHPNYFGEILVWWGIGLVACTAPYGWLAWLGPVAITYLIVFVSGIPPLERRKKDDPTYQAYVHRTSPLIPLPPKR
jgi:steroid 5-alpha reductase family enzyme